MALIVPGLPVGLLVYNFAASGAEDGSDQLPARLAWAAVAVVVSTAVIGAVIFAGERRMASGHGFGARQSLTATIRGGADLPARIRIALISLPAEVRHADTGAGRYAADTGWSWGTYGEHITVELMGNPQSPEARVSSRPRVHFQIYDWGRGRRNVTRVLEALQD